MKIYEVNGRKVWLDKAPSGYEEPKVEKTAEVKTEEKAKTATANKARKTPANKSRKAGSDK